jgi:hypothetical protein
VFGKRNKLPELQGLKGHPPKFGAGAILHTQAKFGVDMSVIGKDGGVQYSLLEALDAGSIPFVTRHFHVPGVQGYAVDSPEELAHELMHAQYSVENARANRAWLDDTHNPARVGAQWLRAIR